MKGTHVTLFYKKKEALKEKLCEFFGEGIKNSQRCVYITSEDDAHQIYEELRNRYDPRKVTKLFSYFTIPDPIEAKEHIEEKLLNLKKTILKKEFQGVVGFNVLGKMTRFSTEHIKKIEEIERYLDKIKGDHLKMLCTFQIGEEDHSRKDALEMGLKTHDYGYFEKDDGSFSQISLENK
jgi:Txe/YoeB family toxin of Txe-Axe toxin-antitoxin module